MDQEPVETNLYGERLTAGEFLFSPAKETEHIRSYKPGGYHPVSIGDVFPSKENSRYRVLHKLRWSRIATVWLAKDMVEECYVALKIFTADAAVLANEVRIFLWLRDQPEINAGYSHIAHVWEYFQIHSPNGCHDVLVMEVMIPLSYVKREASDLIDYHSKGLVCQLMLGVSYLHDLGVTHGGRCFPHLRVMVKLTGFLDLHLGSLGLVLNFDDYSEDDLLLLLGEPECSPVVPLAPTDQTDSLPHYVVSSMQWETLVFEQLYSLGPHELTAKITSLGNAFRLGDKRPRPRIPRHLRAPEINVWEMSRSQAASDWGIQADIWSLGCMVFEIACSYHLFYRWGTSNTLLVDMAGHGGPFPPEWLNYMDFPNARGAPSRKNDSVDQIGSSAEPYQPEDLYPPPKAIVQPLQDDWLRDIHAAKIEKITLERSEIQKKISLRDFNKRKRENLEGEEWETTEEARDLFEQIHAQQMTAKIYQEQANNKMGLSILTTGSGKRDSSEQSKFRADLIQAYNSRHPGPED
ncbi:hypothetical protein FQN54_006730 [Arachnomyces sp. PD_36]|nr:hypothetical protein FQN54_006730 [Arachnomyces sp. PD_36]